MLNSIVNLVPEFISDALLDSIKLLPALFLIFIFIEIFENYFAHKVTFFISLSKKFGVVLCALLAIIPQCGFSVIMTALFLKKYITIGSLIAVYIATSDEAIPILLTQPSQLQTIGKIIFIKLLLAVFVGYITDLFIKTDLKDNNIITEIENETGCCDHNIVENKIKNIIFHPIKHTAYIFMFILLACIILNYILLHYPLENITINNKFLEPVIFSFIGLIPNCATSVFVTMLFLKNVISFGSVVASLTTNAGLGLIVLFSQKSNIKTTFQIISILLIAGILAGLLLNNI